MTAAAVVVFDLHRGDWDLDTKVAFMHERLTLVQIYEGHVVREWSPLGRPSFWTREQRPRESPAGSSVEEARLTGAEHLGCLSQGCPAILKVLRLVVTSEEPCWGR
jgi:hypothetical protein